jgi:hypothetical protein
LKIKIKNGMLNNKYETSDIVKTVILGIRPLGFNINTRE